MRPIKFLLAATAALLFASCTLEHSDNGNLDGYWKMTRVDTLSSGGSLDLSQQRRYWGIEHKLVSLRDIDGLAEPFYTRFSYTGDSLIIHTPYANHGHEDSGEEGGDIPLTEADTARLAPYALTGLRTGFAVQMLEGRHMVLCSDRFRVYFTRM